MKVTGSGTNYTASFPGTATAATYHVASGQAVGGAGDRAGDRAGELRAWAGRRKFLVIAHEDFINADLQRLVDARVAEGYTVGVVPTGGLYAQYTYGIFDPAAIRACVKAAVAKRGTKAVLLVGSDTYDYLDYFQQGTVSHLPSFYAQTGGMVRWAPADGLFVDVDGDGLPDVAVGRFPVRTADDLKNIVDRTLQYRTKTYGQTAVFAADRIDTDYMHDFRSTARRSSPSCRAVGRCSRPTSTSSGVGPARGRALIDAINAGTALTAFVGHSGPTYWTFDGLVHVRRRDGADQCGQADGGDAVGLLEHLLRVAVRGEPEPQPDAQRRSRRGGGAGGEHADRGQHETEFGKRLFGVGGLVDGTTTIGDAVLRTKRSIASRSPRLARRDPRLAAAWAIRCCALRLELSAATPPAFPGRGRGDCAC